MADYTVLKVQVENVGTNESDSSLAPKKSKGTGSSLAAGALAGKIASGSNGLFGNIVDGVDTGSRGSDTESRKGIRSVSASRMRGSLRARTELEKKFGQDWGRTKQFTRNASTYMKNVELPSKGQVTAGAGMLLAAFAVTSEYQRASLEMTGATHAAGKKARQTKGVMDAAGLGIMAVATGPYGAVAYVAYKAYALGQENRRKLYDMEVSQIQSTILQRNLVKNVAERRF